MGARRDSNACLDRKGSLQTITVIKARISILGPVWAFYVAALCLAALPTTSLPVGRRRPNLALPRPRGEGVRRKTSMVLRPGVPAARVLWKVFEPLDPEQSPRAMDPNP